MKTFEDIWALLAPEGEYKRRRGACIAMRSKIRDRLKYLYKKYVKQIKAPTKLQRAIMADYYARFSTENGPIMDRRKPVNDPMKCGKKKLKGEKSTIFCKNFHFGDTHCLQSYYLCTRN